MLEIMYWFPSYGFVASPPMPDKTEFQERVRQREGARYFAVFEDGAPAACAAAGSMTQQVRGAMFKTGGIFDVVTHPAARRKGYARRVMARLFEALRDDAMPLSCLYPFRDAFYERLGYVTFPQPRKSIFTPSVLTPLLKTAIDGEVELMLLSEGVDVYREFVRRVQARTHGMATFDNPQPPDSKRRDSWMALAKVQGEPAGVMLYKLKGDMPTKFNLSATRFYYSSSAGKYLLLRWIAGHDGQAERVELALPAFEMPETWFADIRTTMEPFFFAPMGRVIDVAGVGGIQVGPGRFSARITDALCPWNTRAWQFEAVDGVLRVSESNSAADCELSIHALAALVYGTQDPGDFAIRGWGSPSQAVQATMRAMFAPKLPHLHEVF
jgi:predicted acetyltransferase